MLHMLATRNKITPQRAFYMAKSFNLGEIYSEPKPKNSVLGRKCHRLCAAVDFLDNNKLNASEILNQFHRFKERRDSAKTAQLYAEYQLLCAHLSWLGNNLEIKELCEEFQAFGNISSDEGLLSRGEEDLNSEHALTFLLDSHERQTSAELTKVGGFRRDVFETATREDFLPRIIKVIGARWSTKPLGISQHTLDTRSLLRNSFLQFMHKQLLQNALCHAFADSTFNPKYNKFYRNYYASEGDEFLFGSLAFLDVQLLDPKLINEAQFADELRAIHPNMVEDTNWSYARLTLRKSRILIFSYCDTGPGIERHIRTFSPRKDDLPNGFDIKFVLDNRVAGREDIGSGMGLSDVRQLSREVGAKFVIETSNSIYLDDQLNNQEYSSERSRMSRGTTATVVFEV